MRKVVFIGGAPAVGKSFLARKMAEELKLPWISTDSIRGAMRKIVRREDYPHLFDLDEEENRAEQYLTSHTPKQMVDEGNMESEDVWKGVLAFLETDYVWQDFIVEGIAVTPKLVSQIALKNLKIYSVFLVDKNEDRIKKIVYDRGVWDDAKTYSDEVKPIEVTWVKLFNQWVLDETTRLKVTPFIIGDRDKDFLRIISKVEKWMAEKAEATS